MVHRNIGQYGIGSWRNFRTNLGFYQQCHDCNLSSAVSLLVSQQSKPMSWIIWLSLSGQRRLGHS